MITKLRGQLLEKLTYLAKGKTILRPGTPAESTPEEAAKNLRRKLIVGAVAGLATLAIAWSLGALGVIKVACDVVSVVGLLVDFGAAYLWPAAAIHINAS